MRAISGWFRWEPFQGGLVDRSCFRLVQMGAVSGWRRWDGLDGSCFRLEEMGWFRWELFQAGGDGMV